MICVTANCDVTKAFFPPTDASPDPRTICTTPSDIPHVMRKSRTSSVHTIGRLSVSANSSRATIHRRRPLPPDESVRMLAVWLVLMRWRSR
jgi:hypothetical protein